jgi:hypothetical protein
MSEGQRIKAGARGERRRQVERDLVIHQGHARQQVRSRLALTRLWRGQTLLR